MFKYFRPRIRSRHPSHAPLRTRGIFPLFPFRSVIRFGSTTEVENTTVEINSIEAVKNSSSKIKMKECFTGNNVKTADWYVYDALSSTFIKSDLSRSSVEDLPYPIISKSEFGSRNQGNKKHDTVESLREWLVGKNLSNYIFEKYYNYTREYRLHVSQNGCFYTCRKMLKEGTPDEDKWYRNDEHCVWILEDNKLFDKPVNWDNIVEESVKALNAVGLDIGAIDLRIQGAKDSKERIRENPDFIIVEINSAPSFGDITIGKYITELTKLLIQKNERN